MVRHTGRMSNWRHFTCQTKLWTVEQKCGVAHNELITFGAMKIVRPFQMISKLWVISYLFCFGFFFLGTSSTILYTWYITHSKSSIKCIYVCREGERKRERMRCNTNKNLQIDIYTDTHTLIHKCMVPSFSLGKTFSRRQCCIFLIWFSGRNFYICLKSRYSICLYWWLFPWIQFEMNIMWK